MALCNRCSTYACDNNQYCFLLLTGHHPHCADASLPEKHWSELVKELCRGMEAWAADEDGIHPSAWQAYARAKAILGTPVPFEAQEIKND